MELQGEQGMMHTLLQKELVDVSSEWMMVGIKFLWAL